MKQLTVILVKPIHGSVSLITSHRLIMRRKAFVIYHNRGWRPTEEFVREFYPHVPHFFQDMYNAYCTAEIEIMLIAGDEIVKAMRDHVLRLRKMFQLTGALNGWHASDSPQQAAREIAVLEQHIDRLTIDSTGWF